jgi:hypothetical protein
MAQKFLTDISMGQGTSVINLVVDPRASEPTSPAEGQIYYNITDDVLYYYNGTAWQTFGDITAVLTPSGSALSGGGSSDTVTLQVVVDNSTIEISSNALRIKDGGVTFAKLNTGVYTNSITGNASDKLTTENAVKTYVDATIAGLGNLEGGFAAGSSTEFPTAVGGTKKGDYWYVTSSGTVNGVLLEVGDVLIAAINNPNVNTSTDWIILQTNVDQATETIAGIAKLATQAQTNTGTNDTNIVTPLKLKTFFDTVVGGFAANVGNGSSLSFLVTHNLNTLDVVVQVVEISNGDTVYTDVARTNVNAVTVTFATAPSANQYRIIIKK